MQLSCTLRTGSQGCAPVLGLREPGLRDAVTAHSYSALGPGPGSLHTRCFADSSSELPFSALPCSG